MPSDGLASLHRIMDDDPGQAVKVLILGPRAWARGNTTFGGLTVGQTSTLDPDQVALVTEIGLTHCVQSHLCDAPDELDPDELCRAGLEEARNALAEDNHHDGPRRELGSLLVEEELDPHYGHPRQWWVDPHTGHHTPTNVDWYHGPP